MTQTMSHPNDWAQFYHQISFSGQASHPVAEAPAMAPPDTPPISLPGAAPNNSTHDAVLGSGSGSSAAGRVAKPKRRRSRASRRTPTTLLSTDTANFRAMVQQFTGAAHFGARLNNSALDINFGTMDPAGRGVVHHASQQRPAFSHAQDQVHAYMLSLDPATSSEFPPFMQ